MTEQMERRVALANRVAQYVFDNTNSFNDESIGCDLSYLLWALISGPKEYVDWTIGDVSRHRTLATLLQENKDLWNALLKERAIEY